MGKKPDRRAVCEQLLSLRLKHAKIFGEMDSLKAELILIAGDAKDGFREVFAGKGRITVAAPKAKEFKGDIPEVNPVAFYALSDAKRQKLIDDGLITLVRTWTREFHGRVDVKTF
jgi:hypothetical protein